MVRVMVLGKVWRSIDDGDARQAAGEHQVLGGKLTIETSNAHLEYHCAAAHVASSLRPCP
jgi:hypothetical protein